MSSNVEVDHEGLVFYIVESEGKQRLDSLIN